VKVGDFLRFKLVHWHRGLGVNRAGGLGRTRTCDQSVMRVCV
jgi:hypothetical protein